MTGRADDYNAIQDRLLSPGELTLESGKLVLMEENQGVVFWGTDGGPETTEDPTAYQATNADPLTWEPVNDCCSVFLLVMLHWAAAFAGAMPLAQTASVDERLRETLNDDWCFVGEVNGFRAYNQPDKAICFVRWEDGWRIFAGAVNEATLNAISVDLDATWNPLERGEAADDPARVNKKGRAFQEERGLVEISSKWAHQDSNLGPYPYQGYALAN